MFGRHYFIYMENKFPVIHNRYLGKRGLVFGPDTEDNCQYFVDEWVTDHAEKLVCQK